jgi:hypothetical protein
VPSATKKAPKPLPEVDPAFAPVVAAFADDTRVSRTRMFSSSNVLSVNGKIFAMLTNGKLVVKLPKARVEEIVRGGHGEQFDPGHGRPMKEWVVVGATDVAWIELAKEAHQFVSSLQS